jgi:phage portal protein, SPP1 gp6-like|nr:MAG TPA: PORTAL PROTEIN [Caudoviricetes sp.]
MLTIEEIKQLIDEDAVSDKKKFARKGQEYYEGDHDIRGYRLFYYNADGELVEDKTRSNVKIPHAFFAELVDQAVQYILSGSEGFIKSDFPELQSELDQYFNCNEDFTSELSETLTGCISKGFEYMYAYKNQDDRISFQCADSLGVVEVRTENTDSETKYVIYSYVDRIEKGRKRITRIQVWDSEQVYFYIMTDEGEMLKDASEKLNPKPHTLYEKGNKTHYGGFGFIPFFRLDNNKKQFSGLKPVKDLIDDYDLMASSLSNNLIDFDTPIHVVKGLDGDSMDELIQNLKTKKVIGLEADTGSGVDIKTVDIPYQARLTKLELDEKNIYRFGMGLNTSGLKDTNATTNIAIKAAYSLLDLKCSKLEIRLKQFLRKLLKPVLDEINARNNSDYQMKDIYFELKHEVMSNAQENSQIALTEAQTKQTEINTLLNLAANLDAETLMQNICEILDIDYEEIRNRLPDQENLTIETALEALNNE